MNGADSYDSLAINWKTELEVHYFYFSSLTLFVFTCPDSFSLTLNCSHVSGWISFTLTRTIGRGCRLCRRRRWHPTPVLLPGKSDGWRSLVGCSPWDCEESDTTEWLHFHFSLSCTGEGNGNPLQCSCLENPRDRGAWWAAVYGVAQSQTRLKWLSSSSSSNLLFKNRWVYLFF